MSSFQKLDLKYQYNETNVMHFSFNLLRIKGLYMFRALLAHPQEALNKRRLVYWVRIRSVPQPTDIIRTQYTKCRFAVPPENKQVMLETCRGPWFSINRMKSASRWFHCTDILWRTFSKTLSRTDGRRLARSTSLRPQLELWFGLAGLV
jgi:hypothetical protein